MIQTIYIGHLLRETVTSPYRNLVTRPTGAAIRNRIQAALADSGCLTALLDFSGIELLDLSCADEVVAKLLLSDAERGGPAVVLRGLREDHAGPRLLGWVTPDARAAFACLYSRGALTAAELAAALGWVATRGAEALNALALRRLVRADEDRYYPLLAG